MTKADIAERLADKTGLAKKDSVELVESVFKLMKGALEQGEGLKIAGFGTFAVKEKGERRGRNPQTGGQITIGARRVLSFRASQVLKSAVNRETVTE